MHQGFDPDIFLSTPPTYKTAVTRIGLAKKQTFLLPNAI